MAQTAVNKAIPRKLPIFRGVWGVTFGFPACRGCVTIGAGGRRLEWLLFQSDSTHHDG